MNWYLTVLKKYAVFSGRARRTEFWMFFLFNFIFGIIAGLLDRALGLSNAFGYGTISILYSLAMFIPGLAVTVRRLHDVGKSGWMFLIALIPIIGWIWLFVLYVTDSNPGENQYGKNPKDEPDYGNSNPEPLSEKKNPSYDEIEKLASLKEKGIISEEEFQAKKKELLNL